MPGDLSAAGSIPRSLWALARRLHPARAPYATTIPAELAPSHDQLDRLRRLADSAPEAHAVRYDRLWRRMGEELASIASDLGNGSIAVDDLPEQLTARAELGATYMRHKGDVAAARAIFPAADETTSVYELNQRDFSRMSLAERAAAGGHGGPIRLRQPPDTGRARPGPGVSGERGPAREQVEVRAIDMFGRPLTTQEFDDAVRRLEQDPDDGRYYSLAPAQARGDARPGVPAPLPRPGETIVRVDGTPLTVREADRFSGGHYAIYWVDARCGDLKSQVRATDLGEFVRHEIRSGRRLRFIDRRPVWSGR